MKTIIIHLVKIAIFVCAFLVAARITRGLIGRREALADRWDVRVLFVSAIAAALATHLLIRLLSYI